ncbi:MAG: TIGR04283 family arsenosugar biosynthesis glycosyltransferase [Pseudomonadota bacterium]
MPAPGLSIIVPTLNEAKALPQTLASIAAMEPPALETIVADAGSTDQTVSLAREAGVRVLTNLRRGRAAQMNAGAAAATGDRLCFLHADTPAPKDLSRTIQTTLENRQTACAGFVSIMRGPDRTRWVTSAHNYIKSYYAPALFRPVSFVRGVRLLFGDQAIFCRSQDFHAIGGFDPEQTIMEEADFLLRMVRARRGRVRQIHRLIYSSDRRVAAWGSIGANIKYLEIGILWGIGIAPDSLAKRYKDVR